MAVRGIKAHIFISVAIVLVIAMGAIDIVFLSLTQRELLKNELKNSLFDLHLIFKKNNNEGLFLSSDKETFNRLLSDFEVKRDTVFECVGQLNLKNSQNYFSGNCSQKDRFHSLLTNSVKNNQGIRQIWDRGVDVLWKKYQFAVITEVIRSDENVSGVVGAVVPLNSIYLKQRKYQKIIIFYIFINTMILAPLISFRLFAYYFKPIKRLAKRASEYKDEEQLTFTVRKEDDELDSLSSALNSMIDRISTDKEKLRYTIKELESVNHQLKEAQQKIIRAEKLASLGRLSSGIAHEIGNPLGIILGYLDLLKSQNLIEEKRIDYINRAEDETRRIDKIIRQLSDLSNPKSIQKKTANIHTVVNNVVSVLEHQPSFSNIQFEKQFNAVNDLVLTDSELMRQVFLNLLLNASDAVTSITKFRDGLISIFTEELERYEIDSISYDSVIKITVSDNGPGISHDIIGDIFDPFLTTKDPGKGTGLGLYVSLMIVEKLGGTILAENNHSCGVSMSIFLPIFQEN